MKYWVSIPSGKVLLWYLILPVLILLVTETHQAQTVIKEKVEIKPSKIIPTTSLNTVESLFTVNFTVTWEADIEGWIEIGGVNSSWVKGGASLSVQNQCQPSFTGAVKLNIPELETHSFTYSLEVVGIADTSGTGSLIGTNPSPFLGWPPTAYIELPINNYSWFSVGFWNTSLTAKLDQLCFGNTIVPWPNFHFGCSPLTTLFTAEYINMKIDPEIQGVSFYSGSGSKLGSEINVNINESTSYQIKLNNMYKNINGDTIKVVSDIEGIKSTDSLIVPTTFFTLEPYTYQPTLIHDENKYLAIGAIPSSCLNLPLPDYIKYNVEILKGANLASLLNIMTDEKGDTLNNVDHYDGWLEFRLLGDGDNVETDDTIRVKVSTTYPQIAPIELLFVFQAPRIVVTFSPETIAPGDTADVILKKKEDNGTITDFSADQLFDIYIIEGGDYGSFLIPAWGDTVDYSRRVERGFKFIAYDGIPDSITVQAKIAVRTSGGGGAAKLVPGDTSNYGINTFSLKNKKQLKGIQSVLEENEMYYGYGTITIGGGDCSDAPQCNEITESPEIEFNKVDDGTVCANPKQRGGFIAKLSNPFQSINVSACYNQDEDKWQFKIEPSNKIFVKYSLEICDGNLRNMYKEKLINKLEELDTKIPHDSISVCKAFSDILWHQVYGSVHSGDYFIYEATVAHENQHLYDFVEIVNHLYFKNYYDKFLEYGPSCSEINNFSLVVKKGAEKYYGYMEDFRNELIKSWRLATGKSGSKERKKFEQITQDKVKYVIREYYNKLKSLHPDKDPCEYCNVGCLEN